MSEEATTKRTAVKHQQWMRDPAARRQEVLQQQRQARRDLALHTRQLLTEEDPPSSSENEHGGGGSAKRRNRRQQQSRASSAAANAHGMEISSTYSSGGNDAAAPKRKTREERVKQRREHFARQLMVPEWMIDVPRDLNGKGSELGAGWYVLPRPEGKRCLVIANGYALSLPLRVYSWSPCNKCSLLTVVLLCIHMYSGTTIARIPSGSVFKKFQSALPSGSHSTNKSTEAYCILDCIFQEHNSTFYVLDVMCWKVCSLKTALVRIAPSLYLTWKSSSCAQGYLLYNCTTEFRLYWLRDKLSEGDVSAIAKANPFRFMVCVAPCLLWKFSVGWV